MKGIPYHSRNCPSSQRYSRYLFQLSWMEAVDRKRQISILSVPSARSNAPKKLSCSDLCCRTRQCQQQPQYISDINYIYIQHQLHYDQQSIHGPSTYLSPSTRLSVSKQPRSILRQPIQHPNRPLIHHPLLCHLLNNFPHPPLAVSESYLARRGL